MANTKLSGLTAASATADADLFYTAQGGTSKKATALQLKTYCSASPTLVTPVLGVAAGTSLALGGATIGADALGVTGTGAFSGRLTAASFVPTSSTVPATGMYLGASSALNFSAGTTQALSIAASDQTITTSFDVVIGRDLLGGRNVRATAAGAFYWSTRSSVTSPSDGVVSIFKNDGSTAGVICTPAVTVANLISAATAGAGARSFVTDATSTTFLTTVAGTGANKVPVVSDGTNWKIG